MKKIFIFLMCGVAFLSVGALSKQEIERKTDLEVMELLTNSDSSVRMTSLVVLGLRFNNPDAPVIMSPVSIQTPHSEGTALPPGLLERTVSVARNDTDLKTRLAAVMALRSFKYRTNTSPILTALLEDESCIIRIRAAQALVGFVDEYHEPVSGKVVTALITCLRPENPTDDIWQAAETLGNIGTPAKESLPFLNKLEQCKSEKVREYAREAAKKIQSDLKRQNAPRPRKN